MSKIKVANLVFNNFENDSRVLKESISLAKNSYEVEVIAHLDRGLSSYEEREFFKIRRFSYINRRENKTLLSKLGGYLKYIKLSVQHSKKFDILHCNDLDTLPIAFIIKTFFNKKIKVVYDAHEYETERHHQSDFDKKILKKVEKFLLKSVDDIITVSEPIADEYVRLYGVTRPKIIYNAPPKINKKKHNIFREKFHISKEKQVFLYQGSLSRGRNIELITEVFSKREDAVVVFMGYGLLEDFIKAKAEKSNSIHFHEAVSPKVLHSYTSSADFGISMIENICLSYYYCLPNKMFEYFMADVPVLVSNLPEMKKIVEEKGVGVVIKEESFDGLSEAIDEVLLLDKNRIKREIREIKKIYNWEEQEKKLIKLYKGLDL